LTESSTEVTEENKEKGPTESIEAGDEGITEDANMSTDDAEKSTKDVEMSTGDGSIQIASVTSDNADDGVKASDDVKSKEEVYNLDVIKHHRRNARVAVMTGYVGFVIVLRLVRI